ncbi:hypothetical protein [Streptomyces sp. HGB0020]|uniref:hypothetical protein n=1 Tax=Streptomyces sp. HGB0020 TaxID=1078086 RepID=UPI00034E1C15|nr:hypothetical protein [Streptomyces sp. HGB0020]EPD62392.1 hypothetical protein HMPREF1211_04026 [Streptomyces sp. HGB0020]
MGSQDQHRQNEPKTAAEARERAAALTAQADEHDREAGRYDSHDLREQAGHLRTLARQLDRQEQRAKNAQDAISVDAHRRRFREQHTPGGRPLTQSGGDAA